MVALSTYSFSNVSLRRGYVIVVKIKPSQTYAIPIDKIIIVM
jgi:hypothetical protein